jgi:hypothetical protein
LRGLLPTLKRKRFVSHQRYPAFRRARPRA